jgi:hypothetical protein
MRHRRSAEPSDAFDSWCSRCALGRSKADLKDPVIERLYQVTQQSAPYSATRGANYFPGPWKRNGRGDANSRTGHRAVLGVITGER